MAGSDEARRVFNRIFTDLGGVAVIRADSSRLAKLFEWYDKRCRNALPDRSFHFDFVNNRRVNACAASDMGFNLIGLNMGTPVAFVKLFETFLSHPLILPDIGDPSKDPAWEADLSKKDLQDGFADIFPPGIERITSDQTRATFIHHCTQFAMDFIFWHEVFHIVGGHVGYCARRSGQRRGFAELEDHSELTSETRQALELDADLNAATMTGGIWLKEPFQPGIPFRNTEEALRTWAFALSVLFLVFDQSGAQVQDYRRQTHPHPSIRAGIAHNSVAGLARATAPHQEAAVDRAWEKSSRDCKHLTQIFKLRPTWINAWEAEPDIVIWSMDHLVDHMESIQHEVRAHSKR